MRQNSHLPQDDDARDQDAIARLEAGDAGADLLDDADALVAEDAAGLHGRHVALEDVQVGAADRGRRDPDHRIGRRLQDRTWPVLDRLLARPR